MEAGTRIELPEECRTARTVGSVSGSLGHYGNEITWPLWTDSKGRKHDLGVLRGATAHDSEVHYWPINNFPADSLSLVLDPGGKEFPAFADCDNESSSNIGVV